MLRRLPGLSVRQTNPYDAMRGVCCTCTKLHKTGLVPLILDPIAREGKMAVTLPLIGLDTR